MPHLFPSPLEGGPSTAIKTASPARGWAAGISCRFLYGISTASQNSPQTLQISWDSVKFLEIPAKFGWNLLKISQKISKISLLFKNLQILNDFWVFLQISRCAAGFIYRLCRSRQALSNAYLVVKIGFDTAENEPPKVWGGRVLSARPSVTSMSFVFPTSWQAGYEMINRASMPMWGNARKSAGQAKSPGKKKIPRVIPRVIARIIAWIWFLYTKNSTRPRTDFLYTKNSAPQVGAMLMKLRFSSGKRVFHDFC